MGDGCHSGPTYAFTGGGVFISSEFANLKFPFHRRRISLLWGDFTLSSYRSYPNSPLFDYLTFPRLNIHFFLSFTCGRGDIYSGGSYNTY